MNAPGEEEPMMLGKPEPRAVSEYSRSDPGWDGNGNADQSKALPEAAEQRSEERWALRTIISALSLVALIATAGALVLSIMNRAVPQLLLALGSVAVGALITLLVTAFGKGVPTRPSDPSASANHRRGP